MNRGPCAKRRVLCRITCNGWSVTGENDCANPQEVCPRLPGEGYEKCISICQQAGHAELMALRAAKESNMDLKRQFSFAVITGHHWVCEPCGKALKDAGLNQIDLRLQDAAPQAVNSVTGGAT